MDVLRYRVLINEVTKVEDILSEWSRSYTLVIHEASFTAEVNKRTGVKTNILRVLVERT